MVLPNPYHEAPTPTKLESRTLLDSALRAFFTLVLNAAGIIKSAQSLGTMLNLNATAGSLKSCNVREDNSVSNPDGYGCFIACFYLLETAGQL